MCFGARRAVLAWIMNDALMPLDLRFHLQRIKAIVAYLGRPGACHAIHPVRVVSDYRLPRSISSGRARKQYRHGLATASAFGLGGRFYDAFGAPRMGRCVFCTAVFFFAFCGHRAGGAAAWIKTCRLGNLAKSCGRRPSRHPRRFWAALHLPFFILEHLHQAATFHAVLFGDMGYV